MSARAMAKSTLVFLPEEFLAGELRGWGMTHSRTGSLANQFKIDAHGEWDAARKTLQLRETYHFDDGHTDVLDWSIVKGPGGHYTGREPRLIGEAKGEQSGNWFRWRYKRRVPGKNGSESNSPSTTASGCRTHPSSSPAPR